MTFLRRVLAFSILIACAVSASALEKVSRTPYRGAIVIDDESGKVLFEDNADVQGYPASVTKLMTFFVVMDKVHAGQLTLETPITVTAEAAKTGGSQVYLKQGEVFTVDDLLYALMIQSANDAAVALAVHAAGSKEAFVELMNTKAEQLGMTHTLFHSPHGLPPDEKKGQQVDRTTARDLAILSRELINHGDILRYTSVQVRTLRGNTANPFEMRNHNHLLGKLAGCDGLKTGYFHLAGYSLSTTVTRNDRRIIAVILGAETSQGRDLKMMELVERGFASLPPIQTVKTGAPVATPTVAPGKPVPAQSTTPVKTAPTAQQSSTATEPAVTFKVIPPPPAPSKKP
ncbi:MAG TPA: D-alanyl-D-alanine carboxypeptidase family protein [Candidatus Didemnitutus sp.]|nr:D-alanyl-D-alanine carboxypeptidase family protein [Candidatus Didemnitutus sp.]